MQLITVHQTANILNVKTPRLYFLIKSGLLPRDLVVHLGPRQIRVKREGLEEWIERGGIAKDKT